MTTYLSAASDSQDDEETVDLGLICPCCNETLEIRETASFVFECDRCGAIWSS